jgi:hypothetical protein
VSNSVTLNFGGNTIATFSNLPAQGYERFSFTAAASSSSSILSIAFGDDIGEFLLDDVSVTAVPEPASVGLMLIGLAGLGGLLRRRQGGSTALAMAA